MDEFKIKTGRNVDRAKRVRFFTAYALMVGVLWLIFIFPVIVYGDSIFKLHHFLALALLCLPLAFLYNVVVERLGSSFGGLLSGWSSRKVAPAETLSADLERARYSKRQKNYKEALQIIEEILSVGPALPDSPSRIGGLDHQGNRSTGHKGRDTDRAFGFEKPAHPGGVSRWPRHRLAGRCGVRRKTVNPVTGDHSTKTM